MQVNIPLMNAGMDIQVRSYISYALAVGKISFKYKNFYPG